MKTIRKTYIKAIIPQLLFMLLFPMAIVAQVTNIPDPNFEQVLIDLGIDSDGIINGQVLTSDVETVVDLDISNSGAAITDLTGIADFAALQNLNVSFFMGSSLSFAGNENLKELIFDHNNHLLFMDITNNSNLEIIRSNYSMLNVLDLSNKPYLAEVVLGEPAPSGNHGIGFLDLGQSPLLTKLQLINLEFLSIVDLRSGGNGLLTNVWVECNFEGGFDCDPIPCVMVDDLGAAQNNEFPYTAWNAHVNYSADCALGLPEKVRPILVLEQNL